MSDDVKLLEVLGALEAGQVDAKQAAEQIRALRRAPHLPRTEDLGFATIDHDRVQRRGFPEVIFGAGKTPEQVAAIFSRLALHNPNVLCTRASGEAASAVQRALATQLPGADLECHEYHEDCGLLRLWRDRSASAVAERSSWCVQARLT